MNPWDIPCPRCGAALDCGEKPAGTRLRCKCGYRPYLRHRVVGRRDRCDEPFCEHRNHWSLGGSP